MASPCTAIKLGHNITYGYKEAADNTKLSFRTTWPCYSIELMTQFDFEPALSHMT